MTQQVQDLEQRKRYWLKKEKKLEEENQILKEQWEDEVKKQWKINKSSFPTPIGPLKEVIMTTLFSKKQVEFENLAEALEAMAMNAELHPQGINYVVTKYQKIYHEQAPKQCQCLKGFSVV